MLFDTLPLCSSPPRYQVLEEAFEAGRYAAGVKADQIALDAGITRKQVCSLSSGGNDQRI
jgi:hypothetical protein